jgi:thiamine biosynthesis protein ThiS
MKIELNGEEKRLPEAMTLMELVSFLELVPERLAIELNRTVVRKGDWQATGLSDGDRVEIVHFVGGGAH